MCTRRGLLESSRTPVIHFFTSTSVMLEVCEWVITVGSGDSFSYQSISSKSRFLFNRRELKKQIEIANSFTVQSPADLCLPMFVSSPVLLGHPEMFLVRRYVPVCLITKKISQAMVPYEAFCGTRGSSVELQESVCVMPR
jgi:hypothetical protein